MRQSEILTKSRISIPSGSKIKIEKIGNTDGYDGHSLRAFAYFRENMPDILQSEGRRVFEIQQDGTTSYLFEGDLVITPGGEIIPIEEHHASVGQVAEVA